MRLIIAILFLGLNLPASAIGQTDTVVTRRKDGAPTVNRKGTITQWIGDSLTINSNGVERKIDNDSIIKIETEWGDNYKLGMQELNSGNPSFAIVQFEEALTNETRPWAKLIIRAHLIEAYQSIEKYADAIRHFQTILREDPQTRFLPLAPICWTSSGTVMADITSRLGNSRDSFLQLIGASWMLANRQRNAGIEILQTLSEDIDPRIKNIAIVQLWRTRLNVTDKQVKPWEKTILGLPREFRAGPYLVLAEAQSRVGQTQPAIANLMRIPILFPEQKSLVAAALYRAGNLLENQGKSDLAQSILNELVTLYPQTIWAKQINQ
ncbi:tetratricopeptide repeat protein [Mariniblastus sp.]|jgi:tetratricopeptide (TPR) repeat protein|nr:tetratricopeptide repeat protein [Mariniblastus sp.]MDA7870684.1 tetratricopeptide repeat protein [bacterium]MDA7902778.1 tetratricopeptide repeat protein [Mariniblastus sp.]MDA7904344.1 tetratricopeptide repeat protein [bacterium]MDB4374409.1 tetratricopeptide repeat protein [bacterium]